MGCCICGVWEDIDIYAALTRGVYCIVGDDVGL